ncbi:MAG TPA: malonyl-CoA synthase [Steroidobacteraceae bacterium]|jgi:malonyl-CoA/methylmalonyl-CoA synthetase|nr:malonyl-CoA synthase [Steroidobacteraceae bacterium]
MHSSAHTDPATWLAELAQRHPERLLLSTPGAEQLSYGAMNRLVDQIAAALAHRAVAPGDRVVAQVEKSPAAIALYLACLRIGAVFVPLNTAYTSAEIEYFLGDADPKVAVGVAQGGIELAELTRGEFAPGAARTGVTQSDLAALLYTSGTTGRSKGAMLTRANLATNAVTLAQAWRFTERDVLLHALPIFHVHGLFVAINTVLASGSSMLFLPKFDADEVVRLLPEATVMMGVPTFYTRLLQHPGVTRERCANVRLFVSGSAPLLAETHREFRARTGHAILERYGMSETLMNTSNPYDGERVAGSVGPALPGVEVRIADPAGMIEVRGPNVFKGYWRMPEKTAAEFHQDGFFITGDVGRLDERGYLFIVGRAKDLIISGGYNVYPVEVETELDALAGVAESAVIGVPHPDFGEGVTAVVVPRPGAALEESALRAALEQRLAKYKLPKRIVFVTEMPRNAMGKVQKAALREKYGGLYNSANSGH